MKQIIVIFDKPVVLPGENSEKKTAYGIVLDDFERATFSYLEKYIKRYIFPVAELYKDGVEYFDEWKYTKDGKVFYVNDSNWEKYVEKAEKTGVRFAVFGEKCFDIEITDEDVSDVLLTNKDKWERLKAFWH
ncbi:MAG: hypothetical protein II670_04980 [Alphaproteobacteria bacterium]|nr:hypothetical protein [Alphaproteobacteria bacterium]